MNYLGRTEKEITLPSGYTCTVRRQTQYEAIEIGAAPAFFYRNLKLKERSQPEPEQTEAELNAWLKFMAHQTRILLTRCVMGPLTNAEDSFYISDKPPGETGVRDGIREMSWALLDPADTDAIVQASNQLSGLTTAGQEAAKTFPEAPPEASRNGCAGEALRSAAHGTIEPVAK